MINLACVCNAFNVLNAFECDPMHTRQWCWLSFHVFIKFVQKAVGFPVTEHARIQYHCRYPLCKHYSTRVQL